uniref:Uncharacterized protein n=1 Tax=Avena sativa TaxID=4498 RepID=A0ACD5ZHG5_AVESA
MDSEDDTRDSADEDFYSGGEAGLALSDDGDADADYDFADHDSYDSDDLISHRQQQNYSVLSEADIKQHQADDMNRVSTVLSISKAEACALLRSYNWSVSKVHDEWFVDEARVRTAVGLPEKQIEMPNERELTCGICFESCPRESMSAASCGHPFCGVCWRGYISTAINDGPGCLMLRCPDPSCTAAVGQDMVNLLASDEDKGKYERYLCRSYIEDNRKSRQKALGDLQSLQNDKLEKLSDIQSQPESQLKFIIEAWLQIVECRRVLKWTYAYGYYLPDHEQAKRQFFEYVQGEAESGLERLHQCAEKELQIYLDADCPSKDFNDFRTKLAGLTSVTRNYFENLVRALESGLNDVGPHSGHGASSKAVSLKSIGSKSKSGKNKAPASKSGSSSRGMDDGSIWACDQCTFANPRSARTCQVCDHQQHRYRPLWHGTTRGWNRRLPQCKRQQKKRQNFRVPGWLLTDGAPAAAVSLQ